MSLISGGFLGVFTKSFLDKRYHRFSQSFEFKQNRYKAIMILMWVAMNPSKYELEQLKRHRPDIQNFKNLDRELELEYHNAMLFASNKVLKALRSFIANRTPENWSIVAKKMRKDLYD